MVVTTHYDLYNPLYMYYISLYVYMLLMGAFEIMIDSCDCVSAALTFLNISYELFGTSKNISCFFVNINAVRNLIYVTI